MISIGLLGTGDSAADYYLTRQAGCELAYYTGAGERRGGWLGDGARALGLAGELDRAGEAALRGLLAGCGTAGQRLVPPVCRADPRGLLPAAALLTGIERAAAESGITAAALLGEPRLARELARLRGAASPDGGVPARDRLVGAALAGRLAVAAGLDPEIIYPAGAPGSGYSAALAHAQDLVDVRRSGFDVTVSAPKSVSVLWAAGDPAVAAQVRAAHRGAVSAALAYLQTEAGHGLRGHQGDGVRAVRIGTDGLVVVAFEHRTSRAGDPQLHTHLVIPNLVCGADGRWSALDSRALFRHALTASHVYHAVLRGELTGRLGVEWTPTRRGIAEIDGIPRRVLRAFSQRRAQIETALAESGRTDSKAAQRACLATRPTKRRETVGLREGWAARLRELGHEPERLVDGVLFRGRPAAEPSVQQIAPALLAETGLTERRATFDHRALVQAVCQALPPGAGVDLGGIRMLASGVLTQPDVVPLLSGPERDERRYSTTGMLGAEQFALQLAAQRASADVGKVDAAFVGAALRSSAVAGRSLSAEQVVAVRALTGSGRGVEVLVGSAGSGKTAALAVAHQAWRAGGHPVLGATLAAAAARNLELATGIPASSLARLLTDLDQARANSHPALAARSVLVVDEAGLVGTRELARLLAHTAEADAKLVLVGDPAQLPEITAGGLFARLSHTLAAVELVDNRRQRQPWERAALGQLRRGQVGAALACYVDHGRVHAEPNAHALSDRLAADYLRHRAQVASPYDVLVVTARRADVRTANDAIRARLRAAGQLGAELTVRSGADQAHSVATGDLVVVTRNDYPRGLLNGTRAVVTGVDERTGRLGVQTQDGRAVEIPAGWLADGRLDHGYALTAHKAQGLTVDHALVYGTAALSRQSGYVALSRGRLSNHLYTSHDAATLGDQPGCPPPAQARTLDDPDITRELLRRLTRDSRQQLASARLPAARQSGGAEPGRDARVEPSQSRAQRHGRDGVQGRHDHYDELLHTRPARAVGDGIAR